MSATPTFRDGGGFTDPAKPHSKLSCRVISGYCFFQFCLNMVYGSFPTMRILVYKDALKMDLGTLSWMVTCAKTLDVLTGFVLGKMSDETRTKFGRRKPYIIVLWPLAQLVMIMMMSGASIFGVTAEAGACSDLEPLATGNETCAALRACLDAAISEGTILAPDVQAIPTSTPTAGASAFFLVFYCLYFATLVSGSQIPYDALGQELTSNYDERLQLYTWKPIFSLVGAAFGTQVLGLFMVSISPSNLAQASLLHTLVMTVINMLAYAALLYNVKERPAQPPRKEGALPLATSIWRLLKNRRYVTYLTMRVPMTVLGLLPYQVILYLLQNNLQLETVGAYYTNIGIIAIIGALTSTPLMSTCAFRFGRPITLTCTLAVVGGLFVICAFLPFASAPSLLLAVAYFLGVCLAVPYVIPDAMLGDIIDYDELLTGERNEAMFSMVETNVQQLVEIILGAATMFMAIAGFDNLGGCMCGCGVSCTEAMGYPYARWVCPASIGYSCDPSANSITAMPGTPLFYQPEPEVIPCTIQPDAVKSVTSAFAFGIPGICGRACCAHPSHLCTCAPHPSIAPPPAQSSPSTQRGALSSPRASTRRSWRASRPSAPTRWHVSTTRSKAGSSCVQTVPTWRWCVHQPLARPSACPPVRLPAPRPHPFTRCASHTLCAT